MCSWSKVLKAGITEERKKDTWRRWDNLPRCISEKPERYCINGAPAPESVGSQPHTEILNPKQQRGKGKHGAVGISEDSIRLGDSDSTIPGKQQFVCYTNLGNSLWSVTLGEAMQQSLRLEKGSDHYTQQWLWRALYYLDKLWAESWTEVGLCGFGKKIGLAQLEGMGSTPPPHCWIARSALSWAVLRQRGMTLRWKSVLVLLNMTAWGPWTLGTVGACVEAPPDVGQWHRKFGVSSKVYFFFNPLLLLCWQGGAREPCRTKFL